MGSLGTNNNETLIKILFFFSQENAFQNVVCKMASIPSYCNFFTAYVSGNYVIHAMTLALGPVSIKRPSYLRMAISMVKIRRPLGRLIFNMGIAIPGKTVFLIETAPRFPCLINDTLRQTKEGRQAANPA